MNPQKETAQEKPCDHYMVWNIQGGYSYYRCSLCNFIDGKKTFEEAIARERERIVAWAEEQWGKYGTLNIPNGTARNELIEYLNKGENL